MCEFCEMTLHAEMVKQSVLENKMQRLTNCCLQDDIDGLKTQVDKLTLAKLGIKPNKKLTKALKKISVEV